MTSPQSRDKTSSEFKSFVDDDLPELRLEFEKFFSEKDRLDNCFSDTVVMSKYSNVSFVIKLLLSLSHGQACVERGFSNNKSILKAVWVQKPLSQNG